MKVEAPNDRPSEQKNRKGLDWNPCDKWGDTWTNWVRDQNSYRSPATAPESLLTLTSVATRFISPAMAPESLLEFLTSLLNLQQHQKACWYSIRSQINPQVHGYCCSFHPGVFQGIDFFGEREV
jgi:hypothetical protein